MEGIVIRDMTDDDLMQVHEIEHRVYRNPWSVRSFSHELGHGQAMLKVATFEDAIIGYICLRSIVDITHVMKITVLPRFRRRGVALHLLEEALRDLWFLNGQHHQITLEVRESNKAAIGLYEKSGFKEIGRRKGYYRSPDEDAILMGLCMQPEVNR